MSLDSRRSPSGWALFFFPSPRLVSPLLVWLSAKAADRLLPEGGASWSERFGGALLLYLILYEISPLFTDPVSIFEHPSPSCI